ncbi:MAG TPA: alpha/beta family hydrolase [Nitrososphaeraceae archaeon]|nr:alpha/beta family hydrolase [Nitrososphaeraceae archaeon]
MSEHEQLHFRHDIVRIAVGDDNDGDMMNIIEGNLTIPNTTIDAKGTVIFAHGSGSSRHSPRNQYVAQVLNNAGIATLLIDLLTKEEEKIDDITREHRFNIRLLARRLLISTDWLSQYPKLQNLSIGYFGASTGAAAALVAASERTNAISAIVSRGGRPDLAGQEVLNHIQSPTLLIVGENDKQVIQLNKQAFVQLSKLEKKKKIVIVQGATHLFEEAGTLEEVARLASGWFECFFLEKRKT